MNIKEKNFIKINNEDDLEKVELKEHEIKKELNI